MSHVLSNAKFAWHARLTGEFGDLRHPQAGRLFESDASGFRGPFETRCWKRGFFAMWQIHPKTGWLIVKRNMCQGLNGMVINPIVGVYIRIYIPSIRIPIKGGMTIPNKTRRAWPWHTWGEDNGHASYCRDSLQSFYQWLPISLTLWQVK